MTHLCKKTCFQEIIDLGDPLQLFMRFFNNTPFMKNLGSMFERPKQRLQAAPKIQKHNIINITKFAGQQTLQQNDEPLNYSIDEAPQVKG